jgi:phage terminase small subunit
MPSRKPAGLNTRHDTAADKKRRTEGEDALKPERGLPYNPPARLSEIPDRLTDHEIAKGTWRRLMRLYGELEAEVVTRLDMDLLVDYCILMEQVSEMDEMRRSAKTIWAQLDAERKRLMQEKRVDEAILMAVKASDTFETIVKLDSRADRKRALLLQWRQSLYLTPRARAGVAPKPKDPEEPPDELEKLLDEKLIDDAKGILRGDGR